MSDPDPREGTDVSSQDADADDLPTWQEAAGMGSAQDLIEWADRDFHMDFTDHDLVLTLAGNAIANGVWRNNSEIENIHAGQYKRPGMHRPRGLLDAEMMVGNIETSRIIRAGLVHEEHSGDMTWWEYAEDRLFDYDRPYAGTPLSEHVTKKVLAQNTKQVKHNLDWMMTVEDLVGRDRFLLGTALCALKYAHFGTPWWNDTIDAWLERLGNKDEKLAVMVEAAENYSHAKDIVRRLDGSAESDTAARVTGLGFDGVVEALRRDPTQLDIHTLQAALGSGLWGSRGARARWHLRHCGNPSHRISKELLSYLGMWHGVTGYPLTWRYAIGHRP